MIATHLIWQAAGRPDPESAIAYAGRCYWCGQEAPGRGRPVKSLPDTFFDAVSLHAADTTLPALCAACGWTLSDKVRLPSIVSARLLDNALTSDGRITIDGERLLVERSGDGYLTRPRSGKGEPTYRAEILQGITGKFRNFIPFATVTDWRMFTKADREEIRAILFNPPGEPWTLCIGDGQKHAAIFGVVSDGRNKVQSIHFEGSIIDYIPGELSALVEAVDAITATGARNEEVSTGRYRASSLAFARSKKQHEPTISRYRGSPILDLAIWLRRYIKHEKP